MEILTWGALITSSGALIALVKFWIDVGKAAERSEHAAEASRLAQAKYDLVKDELNRHVVETARTYATVRALEAVETQFRLGLEQAMGGIYQRLDGMNSRIDSLISATKAAHH